MWNNVGCQIKGLAKMFFWFGFIFSIIFALAVFEENLFISLLIIVGGYFISWVSSIGLYGFGQLIDNSDIIVEELQNNKKEK